VHRPTVGTTWADRRKQPASKGSRLYDTQRWKRLRRAYLAQHVLCECGCGYASTIVDHRKPHCGDERLMFAWDNLEAMTKSCHDAKTAARDGGFGNPVLAA
jgi:5-methylcytosine-specific restriction protein A